METDVSSLNKATNEADRLLGIMIQAKGKERHHSNPKEEVAEGLGERRRAWQKALANRASGEVYAEYGELSELSSKETK